MFILKSTHDRIVKHKNDLIKELILDLGDSKGTQAILDKFGHLNLIGQGLSGLSSTHIKEIENSRKIINNLIEERTEIQQELISLKLLLNDVIKNKFTKK